MSSPQVPDTTPPDPTTAAPSTAAPSTAAPSAGHVPAARKHAAQIDALQTEQPATGPVGKVRDTGTCMLLCLVTLGIYALVWYYMVHDEMKRHSNEGLGGGLALLIAFLIGLVIPFLTSAEIGKLYERRGEKPPVSGATGLWYFPGVIILVGPFVWFIKTNNALNDYWRSLEAA